MLAKVPPGDVNALPVTILVLFWGMEFNNFLNSNSSSSLLAILLFETLSLLISLFSLIFSSLKDPVDFTSSRTPAISFTGLLNI